MTVPIELDELESEFKARCSKASRGQFRSLPHLRDLRRRLPRLGPIRHGPAQAGAHAGLRPGRRSDENPLGLGVHHVRALLLVLSHEGRHPQTGLQMRQSWPRDKRPKGIRGSCDQHIRAGNAMGVPTDDFIWTVEDVAEEIRETQPDFKGLQVSVDRKGAKMAINQNSREPVTEPDELGPLWKILHLVGADWTYPSVMWAGENYCLFLADDEGWRYILEEFVYHIDNNLGCKQVVNTE
jgi:hypothetical protein